jgi:hypothetical protein
VTIRDCRARPGTGQFLATENVSDARRFADNDLADAESIGDADEAGFATSGNLRPR